MSDRKRSILYSLLLVATLAICASAQAENSNLAAPGGPADKPLVIKKKPHARASGCRVGSTGTALVAVIFDKTGVVTNAELLASSGCSSFDRSALKAATKIKFEPAVSNGEPKTVKRKVEYKYTIY